MDLVRSKKHDTNKNPYWYKNALRIFPIACHEITNEERLVVKDLLHQIGNKKITSKQRIKYTDKCIEYLLNITKEFLEGKRETKNEYFLTHRIMDQT